MELDGVKMVLKVVFENPGHDFPQRISYSLRGAEQLEAAIEGEMGGEKKTIRFPFRRFACGGSEPSANR